MDNLTHTLIGVLVGETVARSLQSDPVGLPAQTRRNVLVTLAAVGSNLPDADLVYSFFGAKVNYLLHHRGHTHTIVGALALAALTAAVLHWWLRRRGWRASGRDWMWNAGTLLGTALLHIAMDATNNYGVHPFWPFDNRWFYGDSVFIIEPLLWAACVPLMFLLRTMVARVLVAISALGGIALGLGTGTMNAWSLCALGIVILALAWIGWRASPRRAVWAGVSVWLAVTLVFIATGRVATQHVAMLARASFPHMQLIDAVTTPLPANPLCWEVLLVQTQGDAVALRRGVLALAPSVLPASACPVRRVHLPTTAPLQAIALPDSATLTWHGEVVSSRAQLIELTRTNCEVAALMRFARVPWVSEEPHVAGDLRYDQEAAIGFAEVEIRDPPVCPAWIPAWVPPRADVLEEESRVHTERTE